MITMKFGDINIENGIVNIRQLNSENHSNARDISIEYNEKERLYKISFSSYKKIFVCSRDGEIQSDIMIAEIEDNKEELEIDKSFVDNLKNEVLELIQYNIDDIYIDKRKNQYTGEKDSFIFLKKGSYKQREISQQEYWTNNIFITK